MISLEQIKELQERVLSAVERIRTLSTENATLKANLTRNEERIDELEKLVSAFKSEQAEIEAGIISALSQLDGLEDSVTEPAAQAAPTAEPVAEPAAEPAAEPLSDEPSEDSVEEPVAEPEAEEVTTLNLGGNASADEPPSEEPVRDETPATEMPVNPDDEEPELDIF